jgi:transcriptional regulator with XRE-family HTH domain
MVDRSSVMSPAGLALGGRTSGRVAMDADNDGATVSDAPAIARRRVRLALRNARSAKQLTQSEVANAMGWSLSKVMRIEKGQVNISKGDLRMVLHYLEVTDPGEVEQLEQDANVSRKERYVTDAEDREHFTPAMLELFQYEAAALAIYVYHLLVIPAFLQTEAYARALFDGFDDLSRTTVDARVRRRMERKQILEQPSPPRYEAILDESVLIRPFGGARVMAEQLELLLEYGRRPGVVIRIVPLDAGAVITLMGPFTILELGDLGDGVLYRESGDRDEILQSQQEADRHETIFERLRLAALDQAASRALIERRAAIFRAEADRAGQ